MFTLNLDDALNPYCCILGSSQMDDMEMWWSLIAFLIAVTLVGCPNDAQVDSQQFPSHTTQRIAQ